MDKTENYKFNKSNHIDSIHKKRNIAVIFASYLDHHEFRFWRIGNILFLFKVSVASFTPSRFEAGYLR
jgi:hypothetical protein